MFFPSGEEDYLSDSSESQIEESKVESIQEHLAPAADPANERSQIGFWGEVPASKNVNYNNKNLYSSSSSESEIIGGFDSSVSFVDDVNETFPEEEHEPVEVLDMNNDASNVGSSAGKGIAVSREQGDIEPRKGRKRGRPKGAKNPISFPKVVVQSRGENDIPPIASQYLGEANLAFALGNTEKALEFVLKVIRIVPDYTEPYRTLGLIYDQWNDIDNSLECYTLLNDLCGWRDISVLYRLGVIYRERGELDNAIFHLSKAMTLRNIENRGAVRVERAKAWLAGGNENDRKSALFELRSVILQNIRDKEAHELLGSVYLQEKRFRTAVRLLEFYLYSKYGFNSGSGLSFTKIQDRKTLPPPLSPSDSIIKFDFPVISLLLEAYIGYDLSDAGTKLITNVLAFLKKCPKFVNADGTVSLPLEIIVKRGIGFILGGKWLEAGADINLLFNSSPMLNTEVQGTSEEKSWLDVAIDTLPEVGDNAEFLKWLKRVEHLMLLIVDACGRVGRSVEGGKLLSFVHGWLPDSPSVSERMNLEKERKGEGKVKRGRKRKKRDGKKAEIGKEEKDKREKEGEKESSKEKKEEKMET